MPSPVGRRNSTPFPGRYPLDRVESKGFDAKTRWRNGRVRADQGLVGGVAYSTRASAIVTFRIAGFPAGACRTPMRLAETAVFRGGHLERMAEDPAEGRDGRIPHLPSDRLYRGRGRGQELGGSIHPEIGQVPAGGLAMGGAEAAPKMDFAHRQPGGQVSGREGVCQVALQILAGADRQIGPGIGLGDETADGVV